MSMKVSNFISTLMPVFPFRHETPEREAAWLKSMFMALNHYEAPVLVRAAAKIVDTRTDRRFPLPAECREICAAIVREDNAHSSKSTLIKDPAKRGDGEWRYKLADELIMTELGRRAAREGWVLSLHDHIRRHGSLPREKHEISACIASARGFDEAYRECVSGNGGALAANLIKLGDAMLRRREKLRNMVLGDAA